MTDTSSEGNAWLSKLFRVDPGSEVTLARDFDHVCRVDFLNKKVGISLDHEGVNILAADQERLISTKAGPATEPTLACEKLSA